MQSHQMSLIDIDLNVSIVDTSTDDGDRQEETPTTHLSSNVSSSLLSMSLAVVYEKYDFKQSL